MSHDRKGPADDASQPPGLEALTALNGPGDSGQASETSGDDAETSGDDAAPSGSEYLMVRLKRATGRFAKVTGRFEQYVDQTVSGRDRSSEPPAALAEGEVDETKPTSLYHAVKPRPKAQPISELGANSDALGTEADDPSPPRARYLWGLLVAAGGLTAVLAVAGVVRPPQGEAVGDAPGVAVAQDRATTSPRAAQPRNSSSVEQGTVGQGTVGQLAPHGTGVSALPNPPPATPGQRQSIAFEHRGNAVIVPVRVEGPAGQVELKMVFDTGATLSTLPAKTVRTLGLEVGTVTTKVETANGTVRRPLVVVDSISLGAARLSGGLSVAVCSRCGAAGTAGLLGLNFARHFMVTIDHESGRLVLRPRGIPAERLLDIRPFVEFVSPRSERSRGRLSITFGLRNNSPRHLRDLIVVADEAQMHPPPMARVGSVAPGAQQQVRITGPAPAGNRTFTLRLTRARW